MDKHDPEVPQGRFPNCLGPNVHHGTIMHAGMNLPSWESNTAAEMLSKGAIQQPCRRGTGIRQGAHSRNGTIDSSFNGHAAMEQRLP
jgi:hypothetical protein